MPGRFAIAIFLCSLTLHAQTPAPPPRPLAVSNAVVYINDAYCSDAQNVRIVIDDDDRVPYPLTGSGQERTVITPGYKFDATHSKASLYFGDMHTDCVRAEPDWTNRRAKFVFNRCSRKAVRNITIRSSQLIRISYFRYLPAGDPGTVPCHPRASFFSNDMPPVEAVRDQDEELVLQLDFTKPLPDRDGLRLSAILRVVEGAKKGKRVALGPDRIVEVLAVQRAYGTSAPPTFSSLAIDLDKQKMRELNNPRLELDITYLKREQR